MLPGWFCVLWFDHRDRVGDVGCAMKIFKLEVKDDCDLYTADEKYAFSGYTETYMHVIRADTEKNARRIAENYRIKHCCDYIKGLWFDRDITSCVELLTDGPGEILTMGTGTG